MIVNSLFRRLFRRAPVTGNVSVAPERSEDAPSVLLEAARRLAGERQFVQARQLCDEIIGREPEDENAWLLLGRIHNDQGDLPAARAAVERAIALCPDLAQAYFMRGNLLMGERRFAAAARDFQRAAELDPAMTAAYVNMGTVQYQMGEFKQALDWARLALRVDPTHAVAQLNQGLMLRELGSTSLAETAMRQAVAQHPGHHAARCGLAMILIDQGLLDEARQQLDTVLAVDPLHNEARWFASIAGLLEGRFRQGWQDYDSRLNRPDAWKRPYEFPEWNGRPLTGTLLIYAEQGLGDDILFASCIPDVLACVAHCVIECEPRLVEIFRRSFPAASVQGSKFESRPAWLDAAPAISSQIAAGSLPRLFRNEWGDFPRHQGYLRADPSKVCKWQARLAKLGPGLKVGIAWTGGSIKTRRSIRSLALSDLLPLLDAANVQFVSLQYVDSAAEIEDVRTAHDRQVHDWHNEITDYDETAALVTALDLVISVCTAVVHLSGALGKQVWVMAPTSPEWRYLRTGDHVPWYPAARVFRQQQAGDWSPVVAAVAAELKRMRRS